MKKRRDISLLLMLPLVLLASCNKREYDPVIAVDITAYSADEFALAYCANSNSGAYSFILPDFDLLPGATSKYRHNFGDHGARDASDPYDITAGFGQGGNATMYSQAFFYDDRYETYMILQGYIDFRDNRGGSLPIDHDAFKEFVAPLSFSLVEDYSEMPYFVWRLPDASQVIYRASGPDGCALYLNFYTYLGQDFLDGRAEEIADCIDILSRNYLICDNGEAWRVTIEGSSL